MSRIERWWIRQSDDFRASVGVGIVLAGIVLTVLILNASVPK